MTGMVQVVRRQSEEGNVYKHHVTEISRSFQKYILCTVLTNLVLVRLVDRAAFM